MGFFYGGEGFCTELLRILGPYNLEAQTCKSYLDNTEYNNRENTGYRKITIWYRTRKALRNVAVSKIVNDHVSPLWKKHRKNIKIRYALMDVITYIKYRV